MTASTHTTTNPNFYLLENLKNTFTSQNYFKHLNSFIRYYRNKINSFVQILKNTFPPYRNNRNKRCRCIGNFQNSILFSYIITDFSVGNIDVNV